MACVRTCERCGGEMCGDAGGLWGVRQELLRVRVYTENVKEGDFC